MSHHTNWQCSGSFQLELLLQEIGCGGADVGARRSVLPEFSFAFDQQAWTAFSAGRAPLPSQAYKTGFPRCFLEAVLEGPTPCPEGMAEAVFLV
jgi:hypothetical protein